MLSNDFRAAARRLDIEPIELTSKVLAEFVEAVDEDYSEMDAGTMAAVVTVDTVVT